jgi:hypothetical protein
MRKPLIGFMVTAVLVSGLLLGCAPQPAPGVASEAEAGTGTLQFVANGEDFVRQGFVSKDGWSITFDHVYITLSEITAYQTDPPYDPHTGGEIQSDVAVSLDGVHTVDLAEGAEDADPIFLGEVADAPAGHYNALAWDMIPASSGDASGYTLLLVGTAEKDGETVDFTIGIENEYPFACGEYVGDERKGILEAGGTAELEMTFHFDHVFGDAETPMDDDLNVGALGFEPFAGVAEGGKLDVDMAALEDMLSAEDYQMLVDILPTLGHVGEGHCHYAG